MDIVVSQTDARRLPAEAQHARRSLRLTSEQQLSVREAQGVFDRLGQHLLRSKDLNTPCTLGVTSAIHGEGKTTCSIGLATSLALETGKPVALVETDLRNPSFSHDFDLARKPNMTDWLQGGCALEAVLQDTQMTHLRVAPVGEDTRGFNGTTLDALADQLRRRLPEMLSILRRDHAYVVLDLPPVLKQVNAEGMARLLDGTVFAIRAGVTPLAKVREATQCLQGVPLVAVVHIGPPSAIPGWLASFFAD